MTHKIEEIK